MRIELWIAAWLIFAVSIIYWDMHRWEEQSPMSACHNVEIKMMNDKALCTECLNYCDIRSPKNGR